MALLTATTALSVYRNEPLWAPAKRKTGGYY